MGGGALDGPGQAGRQLRGGSLPAGAAAAGVVQCMHSASPLARAGHKRDMLRVVAPRRLHRLQRKGAGAHDDDALQGKGGREARGGEGLGGWLARRLPAQRRGRPLQACPRPAVPRPALPPSVQSV